MWKHFTAIFNRILKFKVQTFNFKLQSSKTLSSFYSILQTFSNLRNPTNLANRQSPIPNRPARPAGSKRGWIFSSKSTFSFLFFFFLPARMIPLLYMVVFGEGAVALLLVLRIGPLRDLVMKLLDQLKTGKGPATVKTLGCTMSVILLSSVGSIVRIQNKGTKLGTVTPMDQVLWRTHLLEATLIGFTLFMAFIIDRLHHYIQKLGMLKKSVITYRKDIENFQQQEKSLTKEDTKALSEIKSLKEEITDLNSKLQCLKTESDVIEKRRVDAETHVTALQHQSQDLLLEYDRLLEDNQILQKKLLSIG